MENAAHQLERFAENAREFCRWAEKSPANSDSGLKTLIHCLAELHTGILGLPEVEASGDIDGEELSPEAWEDIFHRLKWLPVDLYSVCFDPLVLPPEEPVVGSLADDLSDIYRDLRKGLFLYDAGHQNEAAWEWIFSFRTHWGKHLVSAQYALHAYAQKTFFDD